MTSRKFLLIIVILLSILSCKNQDEIYKEFIVKNGISYPGMGLDLKFNSGYKQAILKWNKSVDPLTTSAIVYWNDFSDSVYVDYASFPGNQVTKIIQGLDDGHYSFTIVSLDKKGGRSVPSIVNGQIFGDDYTNQLTNRPINLKMYRPGTQSMIIDWGFADITLGAVATEVEYLDLNGKVITKVHDFTGKGGLETVTYKDFKAGSEARYRTLYFPDTLSLDTFRTAFGPIKELGKYEVAIPKASWKKFVLPGDWNTPLENLESYYGIGFLWDGRRNVDNFYGTASNSVLPLWTTIDMGNLYTLSRFTLWHRESYLYDTFSVKEFELWGSANPNSNGSWDESWIPLGEYECIKPSGKANPVVTSEDIVEMKKGFQFQIKNTSFAPNPQVPIRYFRLVAKNNYRTDGNKSIRIDEITFFGDPVEK